MISKKQLKELIDLLKKKTGKTQAQLSIEAGYKPKTLSQLMSKGTSQVNLDEPYNQLRIVYKDWLNNSTNEVVNLDPVLKSLRDLENGQVAIRAEIRAYGQYQILKQVEWDDVQFSRAMAVVDKIYGANLKVDDERGKRKPGK